MRATPLGGIVRITVLYGAGCPCAMIIVVIPPTLAATLAAAGFLVIAAFQFALALGAPLGRAAWGGRNAELSPASGGRARWRS